jgi:zinc protease
MRSVRLNCGLGVILCRKSTLPIVTLDMWVRVGSGDEPAKLAGISHFLEHMLFKGTAHLAAGEYDKRIEGLGGYLNAGTSYDYTHYYIEIPAESLTAALEDFADVITNSSIDAEELEREKLVILEEIRRKNDDPNGFLYDNLTREMIAEGAYSHSVLGYPESVSGFSREDMYDHYRRFYSTGNMTLVVCGDFDEATLLEQAERLFADAPRERRPHRDVAPETKYAAPGPRDWPRDWRETYFYMAFPTEPVRVLEEEIANDLASVILSGGRTSRLVNAVREKQRLVTSISAYLPSHRHNGLAIIGGRCAAENLEPARESIFIEIDRLLREGLRDGEEERVRRQLLVSHVYLLESNSDVAGLIGYSQVILGNTDLYTRYTEVARTIPIERALEVIRRTFVREAASMCSTGPALPEATSAP